METFSHLQSSPYAKVLTSSNVKKKKFSNQRKGPSEFRTREKIEHGSQQTNHNKDKLIGLNFGGKEK